MTNQKPLRFHQLILSAACTGLWTPKSAIVSRFKAQPALAGAAWTLIMSARWSLLLLIWLLVPLPIVNNLDDYWRGQAGPCLCCHPSIRGREVVQVVGKLIPGYRCARQNRDYVPEPAFNYRAGQFDASGYREIPHEDYPSYCRIGNALMAMLLIAALLGLRLFINLRLPKRSER